MPVLLTGDEAIIQFTPVAVAYYYYRVSVVAANSTVQYYDSYNNNNNSYNLFTNKTKCIRSGNVDTQTILMSTDSNNNNNDNNDTYWLLTAIVAAEEKWLRRWRFSRSVNSSRDPTPVTTCPSPAQTAGSCL